MNENVTVSRESESERKKKGMTEQRQLGLETAVEIQRHETTLRVSSFQCQ